MRPGPFIVSCITATLLGSAENAAAARVFPYTRNYELSTEFFLVPSDVAVNGHGLASVASVISVPAPNRTVSVFRTAPNGKKSQEHEVEIRTNPIKALLKQQTWALPLAALSAATMLLMAGFEVFVLLKVSRFTGISCWFIYI